MNLCLYFAGIDLVFTWIVLAALEFFIQVLLGRTQIYTWRLFLDFYFNISGFGIELKPFEERREKCIEVE